VPIATRFPENNVRFEVADARARLRFADGTVDVVHARDTHLSVRTSTPPALSLLYIVLPTPFVAAAAACTDVIPPIL
jgi:hypothetical protein